MDLVVPAFLAAFFGGAKGRLDDAESAVSATLVRLPAALRDSAEKGLGALEALGESPSLASCLVAIEPMSVSKVGETSVVASVASAPLAFGVSRAMLRCGEVNLVD